MAKSHLCNIGLNTSSVNPYRGDFISPRPTSEDWTQFSTVKAAHAQTSVAWIVNTIQIRMNVFKLESKIILMKENYNP